MANILVVDDEVGIRELLSEILGDEGHSVLTAENAARARELRGRADLLAGRPVHGIFAVRKTRRIEHVTVAVDLRLVVDGHGLTAIRRRRAR